MPEIILSKEHNVILVPDTPQLREVFPDAPTLDGMRVLPHENRETLWLRAFGYGKIPAPILSQYDWCGGTPFEIQKITCDLLTSHPRAYVLNDLGTGKTRAALWAWDYLCGNGLAKKALVVCPLSTMNFVWRREAFQTIPHRKVAVLHGSKKERIRQLYSDADLFIINHDGPKVIHEELLQRGDIDVLILDELAVYRNNSDRSKLMRKLARRFNWIWGMTGAPTPNAPTDVWGQAQIVTPNTVPKFFRIAREQLMYKVGQFKWLPKDDAAKNAAKMLQPSVRFTLDDVMELPEIVYRTIEVELSAKQKDAYTKLAKELRVQIDNKTITALNAATAMNKLLQIASGWVYSNNPETVDLEPTERIEALIDLINDASQKVLVFAPFRHTVEGLLKPLENSGIETTMIHGDTSPKDRDIKFHLFQTTDKYKVLLAHPACLAHGLTLTAAATTIWVSPIASLEIFEQANARIRRPGQIHRQQIIMLQGTPVEKKIYSLLVAKQKIQDQLLTMVEEATEKLT